MIDTYWAKIASVITFLSKRSQVFLYFLLLSIKFLKNNGKLIVKLKRSFAAMKNILFEISACY